MSCECYQIGGRFIAEDPDCPLHGREAQERDREREEIINDLQQRIAELHLELGALAAYKETTCDMK